MRANFLKAFEINWLKESRISISPQRSLFCFRVTRILFWNAVSGNTMCFAQRHAGLRSG